MINLNRASSAIDSTMHRRAPSPIARIASANPSENPRSQSMNDATSPNGATAKSGANWWDEDETATKTPVAATFYQVDSLESKDGFTSLMDSSEMSFTPSARGHSSLRDVEDEDDLGFGNSKSKAEKPGLSSEPQARKGSDRISDRAPELKAAPSSGWLGWLWKRGDSQQGGKATQMNLGEEKNTFYFDKELKRWVNSKAPPGESKPSLPPPPPSRQATAPPETAPPFKSEFGNIDVPRPSTGPARPASAAPPPRAKTEGPNGSMPPPPASRSAAGTPPSSRPSTRTSNKRSTRSRYVDIFQQETQGN